MRRWKRMARILVLGVAMAMALAAEARAQESTLLFYNGSTGRTTTGRVDANGNYADLRSRSLDLGWASIVPDGKGLVLFYFTVTPSRNGGSVTSTKAETRQASTAGTIRLRKRYDRFGLWGPVVSTGDGILLLYDRNSGVLQTGRIEETGDFIPLHTHTGFNRSWTHIVPTSNGLVLFYDLRTEKAEVGRVGANGIYQALKSYPRFHVGGSYIVFTSDGNLVSYNPFTGVLVVGRIDANGNHTSIRTLTFANRLEMVPTTNGRVLLYNPLNGDANFGRFDAQGRFTSGPLLKLDPGWTRIVSVR
jgi:hypothetical protein